MYGYYKPGDKSGIKEKQQAAEAAKKPKIDNLSVTTEEQSEFNKSLEVAGETMAQHAMEQQEADLLYTKKKEERRKVIEQLQAKGYRPVEPELLKNPDDIVFIKVEKWVDKGFHKANIDATIKLLQSMYDKPQDTSILYVQCHGILEKIIEVNTSDIIPEKTYTLTPDTVTLITGKKTPQEDLIVSIPENVACIFPSPFGTLSSSISNYDNNAVGNILDQRNHDIIVKAFATGNVNKLILPKSKGNSVKQESSVVSCGGISPNLQLDFRVEIEPTNIATALWRSFVISSNAQPRNKKAFLPKSDATYHSISTAANASVNKESPLAIGDDPAKNYTLNHTFNLLGNKPHELEAEKNLLEYLDKHDGKISLKTFLEIMRLAFGNKNVICFFDTCTEFDVKCVFNLTEGGIVNMPIDQKDDKNFYDYRKFSERANPDPDIENAYDQYIKATEKFIPIIKQTVYENIPHYDKNSKLRPIYDISYSPIVDIVTHSVMRAFYTIRENYLQNCVKAPFEMGPMKQIETLYEVHSGVLEQPNAAGLVSSNSQIVPYLEDLESRGDIDLSSSNSNGNSNSNNNSNSNSSEAREQEQTFLAILLENLKQFGGHVISYFKKKNNDEKNPTKDVKGQIYEEDSPFLDSEAGGGGGYSEDDGPFIPDKAGGGSMMDQGKEGGSRRRPRNKPKNRKTKKNKKQRKTKNRRNRQPKRNKTRRY
jgi:hypothetical protein